MRPAVAVVIAALLLVSACSPTVDQEEPVTAYAEAPCPGDVSGDIVAEVSCGYLTVPENRSKPGRSIRLLVTRVQPPAGSNPAEPLFVAGTETASVPGYSGTSPTAARVGREVIFLDPRGVGHSEPALECPEVAGLTERTLAMPVDDQATRTAFLDAVAGCHQRLTASGIDLGAYNVTEMAADAEDLRRALGIESWNVVTTGTASRIALEMLRRAPQHIRTVILDSPELPGDDPRAVAVPATRDAIAAVLEVCAADRACAAAYPETEQLFAKALAVVDQKPVTLTAALSERSVPVHVDAAMLVRTVRYMLSDGGSSGDFFRPAAIPGFLADVVAGRLPELSKTVELVFAGDLPYCAGYAPKCLPHHRRSLGVAFTVLCHDIAPFADPAEPARLADNAPGFDAAYGQSPYLDVCAKWPVGAAPADVGQPVTSDVPAYAIVGGFAPFSPPDRVRKGLAGMSRLTFILDPYGEHNIAPRNQCNADIRKAWLDDPAAALDTSCLSQDTIDWALPS